MGLCRPPWPPLMGRNGTDRWQPRDDNSLSIQTRRDNHGLGLVLAPPGGNTFRDHLWFSEIVL